MGANSKVEFQGKRLIDHLLAMPSFQPVHPDHMIDLGQFERNEVGIREKLKTAEVFEISNVADMFLNPNQARDWDLYKDFPCTMPPFANVWLEFSSQLASGFSSFGILIDTLDNKKPFNQIDHKNPQAQHIQRCTLFGKRGGTVFGPMLSIVHALDNLGTPVPIVSGRTSISTFLPRLSAEWASREPEIIMADGGLPVLLIYAALFGLCVLNCKNTSVETHQPKPKLAKAHSKKHTIPLVSFKTLLIDGVKELLRTESNGESDLKLALHICRGHFKDYREHGLFGRNKGLYWWGAQARGTIAKVIALKDYKLAKISTQEDNDE